MNNITCNITFSLHFFTLIQVKQEVIEVEDSPQQEVFDVPSTSTSGSSQVHPEDFVQVELVDYDEDQAITGIYALQMAQNQDAGLNFMAAGSSRAASTRRGTVPAVANLNTRPPTGGYKPGHKASKYSEQESDLILDLEAEDLCLIANAFGWPPPEDLVRAAHDLYLNGSIPGIDIKFKY